MKKLLLTLLLALTVGVGAASAVEKSYTLTFKTGTNTSTQFKAGADLASNLTEGAEYVTTNRKATPSPQQPKASVLAVPKEPATS